LAVRVAQPAVRDRIASALRSVEKAEEARIIYACESGSRAWGFASADSDYDVRFIYVHSPDWYLSIDDGRDVCEHVDGTLDLSGWDIRKALRLLRKSNPPLLEWLRSPVVYMEEPVTVGRIRELASAYFSPRSCLHHYLHMAEGNYREYLRGSQVRIKKYFYVLRPILACMWIEDTNTAPPMEFERLLKAQTLARPLASEISSLLQRKKSGDEMDIGPRIAAISEFIETSLARFEISAKHTAERDMPDTAVLNELFRDSLEKTNQS
jgi:uncharacterized protein